VDPDQPSSATLADVARRPMRPDEGPVGSHPGPVDLDQDLAGLWPVEIDSFHDQRLASGIGDCGTGFHLFPAPSMRRGARDP